MKIDTNNPIPLEGVQRINQTTILHSIFKKGLSSRKQISIETGLDTATVSRSVVPLIENGIIEEVGSVEEVVGILHQSPSILLNIKGITKSLVEKITKKFEEFKL